LAWHTYRSEGAEAAGKVYKLMGREEGAHWDVDMKKRGKNSEPVPPPEPKFGEPPHESFLPPPNWKPPADFKVHNDYGKQQPPASASASSDARSPSSSSFNLGQASQGKVLQAAQSG
jgi:hypothetical protein